MLVCTTAATLPDRHRQHGAITHSTVVHCGADRAQVDHEDAHEAGERRGFHPHRHERGHRRRRALVDVGRPHVERHGGHLEAEADQQQADAEQQERIARAPLGQSAARSGSSLVVPVAP